MARSPAVAASLAFVAGVGAGAWLPQAAGGWSWGALAALAAWAVLLAAGRVRAASWVGLAAFAAVGVLRCQTDLAPLYATAEQIAETDAVAAGRVDRPLEVRDGEAVVHLAGARLRRGGRTVRLALPLQAVVEDGAALDVVPGDEVVARGALPQIRGDRNFGWFPRPAAPLGRRCAARLSVASPAWVRRRGREAGSGPTAAVLRWRAAADAFWKARPAPAGAILDALTTGERGSLPAAVQEDFLRSGLTHLLAISGMNVGFLAGAVFLAARWALGLCAPLVLRVPAQPLAALATLPALWFFLVFSGSQLPVARAALMSGAALAAAVLWRRVPAGAACAAAAALLVARDPRALFTASFQLSFAAVAALLLVARRMGPGTGELAGGRSRAWRWARTLGLVSLAASAATAPLVAFHFQQVSLVGPVANLVAVPLAGFVVLPAAWLALLAQAASPAAGGALAAAAGVAADGLVAVASWFAAPGWAVLRTARPPALATAGLLALVFTLLAQGGRRAAWARACACAAAAAACTAWAVGTHRPALTVAVLDVGQGLSVAVLGPGGASLLFDTGPRWGAYDAGERVVVPALRRLGLWRLGRLVVSHAHPDHAGGAAAVRRLMSNDGLVAGPAQRGLARGRDEPFGAGGVVRLLSAAEGGAQPGDGRDANDRSVALLVADRETGAVLTGDAGPRVVGGIAAAAVPGRPMHLLLQAPHHGASPEACRILAARLGPELVAVPVGRNSYGHPRAEALAAFEPGGRVLRTDREGAILVTGDGRSLEVRTWREMAAGRSWRERLRWLLAGW